VAAGGAIGTAIRLALTTASWGDATVYVVPGINVVGAFLLGVITSLAVRRGDTERSRRIRQFFGTGVMGGFTTYSAFAVAAAGPQSLWLTLATAVVGTLAAWAGLVVVRRRRRA
jgi:fluoride exporter